MKIFISGGGGVLGREVALRLTREGHEVHSLDIYFDDGFEETFDVRTQCVRFDLTIGNALQVLIERHKPHLFIHLAENSSIEYLDSVAAARINFAGTAEILFLCAKHDIRCIVGCWDTLEETNVITQSINQKRKMVEHFNIGNSVFNCITMPRILNPHYPSTAYGTLVNRIWNNINHGDPFFIDHPLEVTNLNFCTIDEVYTAIQSVMNRRTRATLHTGGHSIALHDLVPIALDVFNCEEIVLQGRGEPVEFQRSDILPEHPVRKWIKQEWSCFID